MFSINNKNYPKYTITYTLLILMILICYVFISIVTYNSNRIFDLRKIDAKYRVSLLNKYFDNVYKKNSILIVGDSQMNGSGYPTEYVFSTLLEREMDINVLNLAFSDSRILDNIYILEYAKKKGFKFKFIIFNANLHHVQLSYYHRLKVDTGKHYILGIIKDLKSFINFAFTPNVKDIQDEKFILKKFKNYFDIDKKNLEKYSMELKKLIDISKSISENVIIDITSHAYSGVVYSEKDGEEKLKLFASYIKNICKEKNVHCFEPDIKEDKYFHDIVHFNSRGHKKMAKELKQYIETISF